MSVSEGTVKRRISQLAGKATRVRRASSYEPSSNNKPMNKRSTGTKTTRKSSTRPSSPLVANGSTGKRPVRLRINTRSPSRKGSSPSSIPRIRALSPAAKGRGQSPTRKGLGSPSRKDGSGSGSGSGFRDVKRGVRARKISSPRRSIRRVSSPVTKSRSMRNAMKAAQSGSVASIARKFKSQDNRFDTIGRAKRSKAGVPKLKRDKDVLHRALTTSSDQIKPIPNPTPIPSPTPNANPKDPSGGRTNQARANGLLSAKESKQAHVNPLGGVSCNGDGGDCVHGKQSVQQRKQKQAKIKGEKKSTQPHIPRQRSLLLEDCAVFGSADEFLQFRLKELAYQQDILANENDRLQNKNRTLAEEVKKLETSYADWEANKRSNGLSTSEVEEAKALKKEIKRMKDFMEKQAAALLSIVQGHSEPNVLVITDEFEVVV